MSHYGCRSDMSSSGNESIVSLTCRTRLIGRLPIGSIVNNSTLWPCYIASHLLYIGRTLPTAFGTNAGAGDLKASFLRLALVAMTSTCALTLHDIAAGIKRSVFHSSLDPTLIRI